MSEQPDRRRYTQDEIEQIVAARLREREDATKLTHLEAGQARIEGKIDDLNKLVHAHIQEPSHAATRELLEEYKLRLDRELSSFGVEQIGPGERALFPKLLHEYAFERQVVVKHADEKRSWNLTIQMLGVVLGSILGSLTAVITVLQFFHH